MSRYMPTRVGRLADLHEKVLVTVVEARAAPAAAVRGNFKGNDIAKTGRQTERQVIML